MTARSAEGVNGWARKREWKSRKYFESNRPHPNPQSDRRRVSVSAPGDVGAQLPC